MALAIVTTCLDQTKFKLHEGSFQLTSFSNLSASRFQPSVPRVDGPYEQLWSFDCKLGAMSAAETIELEGFLARMQGRNWAFTAYDPYRTTNARGVGGGYAETNSEITLNGGSLGSDFQVLEGQTTALIHTDAARLSSSFRIKGLPTSLAGQSIAKLGDHVGVGPYGEMNLYMVMNNAVCDSSGEARISIQPGLWKQAKVNDLVQFRNPSARFVFTNPEDIRPTRNRNNFGHATLRAIEVPYQAANR